MKTITTIIAIIFAANVTAQNSVKFNNNISVEKNSNGASIKWMTAAESNTSHFEIEISYDGKSFESIRTVAASETTKWNTNYEAKFKRTYISVEKVYYRVSTVFVDGTSTATEAVSLEVNNGASVSYASIH
jgi:hypothetical protein